MRIGVAYREKNNTGLCEFQDYNPTNHKTTHVQASTMKALAEFMEDSNEQWWEIAITDVEKKWDDTDTAVVAVPKNGPNDTGIFVAPGITPDWDEMEDDA